MENFIGFKEALDLTLSHTAPGEIETVPLGRLVGRVLAEDIVAGVDCPSVSTSRKDGYAVVAADLSLANEQNPVSLELCGSLAAGGHRRLRIDRGQTVRVTTGAPLPEGADAVLSEEFCRAEADNIVVFNTAGVGRNIHHRADDIRTGEPIAARNMQLHPALVGLLAAAGLDAAAVYRAPRVAVIATGDEVVLPGKPLQPGQLYASNMVQICAWLSQFGFDHETELVPDSRQKIREAILSCLPNVDVFLTSGGAWGSERDLILKVMADLNWQGIYHRVRMGPGKPVGFGLLDNRPFFCLPGGPASNEMAFLQLALPALLQMKGARPCPFPLTKARLRADVRGTEGWHDFIHARIDGRPRQLRVHPARLKSTLRSMAEKEAIIIIPENREEIAAGEMVEIQLLRSYSLSSPKASAIL